jgi:CMP/dCMP kinase
LTRPAAELGQRAIAISGALGSGKSSVAKHLAESLGLEFVSTGDLHRAIASGMSLSTLELNRLAEGDRSIDDQVDDVLRGLAVSGRAVVVDSRMAWWFIPGALSVHLTVSPDVGAERMHSRRGQTAEEYTSREEALRLANDRAESERLRFASLYGVDTLRLRNYEVVVDTTSAPVERIARDIAECAATPPGRRPHGLVLSPDQVYPTSTDEAGHTLEVGFSHPYFFVVRGHAALAAAIRGGRTRIAAELVVDGDEQLPDGRSAHAFFADSLRTAALDAWESAAGVRLPAPAVGE